MIMFYISVFKTITDQRAQVLLSIQEYQYFL